MRTRAALPSAAFGTRKERESLPKQQKSELRRRFRHVAATAGGTGSLFFSNFHRSHVKRNLQRRTKFQCGVESSAREL